MLLLGSWRIQNTFQTLVHFIPHIQLVPSDYKETLLPSLSVYCHSLLGVLCLVSHVTSTDLQRGSVDEASRRGSVNQSVGMSSHTGRQARHMTPCFL